MLGNTFYYYFSVNEYISDQLYELNQLIILKDLI